MKSILTLILLFGYSAYSQPKLNCQFKVMAAKEKKCFLTQKITISKIHPLKMPGIKNSMLKLNVNSSEKMSKKHDLFSLEFIWINENLKIVLSPNAQEEFYTLANISLDTLVATGQNQEVNFYKLFIPIEINNSKGRITYIHGLEVGPCFAESEE